jgi:enoyl-CoA hydratase/carnithine racemase
MTEGGFETIRWSLDDGLATITLARPDKRNAVNQAMFEELGRATAMAEDDPAVRAVLVEGDGPSFCAGIDLSLIGDLAGLANGGEFSTFVHLAQHPYRRLALMPKPSVVAVQGHALGAGFQLVLACDLRVVARDVQFGMLEARYGIIPDLGGMHHLVRLVGPARAKDLVWTARSVGAEEAEGMGLANHVVDVEGLHDRAEELARLVMANSPTAVGLAKGLIGRAFQTPLEREFDLEAEAQQIALSSQDHRESVAAFLEGRPPTFGRST